MIGAAALGAAIVFAFGGQVAGPARPATPAVSVATLIRTNLSTSVLTAGTLEYTPARPVIDQLGGTYTWLPPQGARLRAGDVLYRVDDVPAVLMVGPTPAWRVFALGMTAGPDVLELQRNLIALGFGGELSGRYDWATVLSVERWQAALGETVTGQVPLGQVVFEPSGVRVGALAAQPGDAATPGQAPFTATSTGRSVSVPLNPNLPATWGGERVRIVLPSGVEARGRIAAIGPATLTVAPLGALRGVGGVVVAVQVSLTTTSAHSVLAAPVSALLALADGGYAVELVRRSGTHRLVAVRTGLFAGAEVQISGAGLRAGTRVVVAQ